jgi:hypothetical protein
MGGHNPQKNPTAPEHQNLTAVFPGLKVRFLPGAMTRYAALTVRILGSNLSRGAENQAIRHLFCQILPNDTFCAFNIFGVYPLEARMPVGL